MRRTEVADITLKAAAHSGKKFTFRDKTEIARCIDSIGADVIELPEAINGKEDEVVNRTISTLVKNSIVAIPVGLKVDAIETAWLSVKDAVKPRLQVEVPTSTVQMEYVCHLKSDKMLDVAVNLCKEALAKCADVEFVAVDATRAEREFLKELCKAVADVGVSIVTLSDDAGVMMPDEFGSLVADIKSVCSAKIYVKPFNTIGLAAANAVSSVKAGADGVKAAVIGDCVLEAGVFADIIRAKGNDMGVSCGLNVAGVHRDISELIGKVAVTEIVSENSETKISLNKNSTLSDVCEAVRMLGYELSDEDYGKVYEEFKRVSAKKSKVGKKELDAVVASAAMQVPSTYHLESYVINSGNVINATANIVLTKDGEKLYGISMGDGPINAAFLAIEQIIGHHYELDDFQIQSVTEGHEALGSAIVKLRDNGVLFSGNGVSTDIIGASIRAYVNALNKIVYDKK